MLSKQLSKRRHSPCRMVQFFHKVMRRCLPTIAFLVSLVLCLWIGPVSGHSSRILDSPAIAQSQPSLIQQGVDAYQSGDFRSAITTWEQAWANSPEESTSETAILLENLARAYQQLGQAEQALSYWQQATDQYRDQENWPQVGRMLTEQAQTYSRLGQNRQALGLLCGSTPDRDCAPNSALDIARQQQDRRGEVAALGALGEIHRLRGNYEESEQWLQAGQVLAETLNDPIYLASITNSLGTLQATQAQDRYRRARSAMLIGDDQGVEAFQAEGQTYDEQAMGYLRDSLAIAQQQGYAQGQLQALVNAIPLYYRTDQPETAQAAWRQAFPLITALPDSQAKVYGLVNLARLQRPASLTQPFSKQACFTIAPVDATTIDRSVDLLQRAIAVAQTIADSRSESFAAGELGHIYECRRDYEKGLAFTQQARAAAESYRYSRYLWEWQTGRIWQAQGDIDSAIAAYEKAVATLEPIRSDILTVNRDIQFDFRDTIEPIYRQLVGLKLTKASASGALQTDTNSPTQIIDEALNTADSLRLAELENYFGDDCTIAAIAPEQSIELAASANGTAVISSVILADRTAVVASLPNGQKRIAWIDSDQQTLRDEVNEYRRDLERFYDPFNPRRAQTLYNWMIRPFEEDLVEANIQTLVFVPDGILRTVPMAALYDGETFLVENYAIAITPSLQLTTGKTESSQFRALAAGLTQRTVVDGEVFPALRSVPAEIATVVEKLPDSQQLLDQNFSREQLEQALAQDTYPVLHIATHGKFNTEADETFLVTGDGQKLTITELEALIRKANASDRIELLALTACQTATGEDRAALGLAGVAAQAGVRSVLASLWFIVDSATAELVTEFYEDLTTSTVSKADALASAQRSLIRSGAHPSDWAPLILIGNWL